MASEAWLNRIDSCLGFHAGDRVADIGSGDLYNITLIASKHPDVEFYAVDIKWSYRFSKQRKIKKLCKKYRLPYQHNIHTSRAGYTSSRLTDRTFDKVLLLNTFHDLGEQAAVVADIKRIMKPGATLVIEEALNETETTCKPAGCLRPFYTEAAFKEKLKSYGLETLHEEVVYKPLPQEKYFTRKQFRCRFK